MIAKLIVDVIKKLPSNHAKHAALLTLRALSMGSNPEHVLAYLKRKYGLTNPAPRPGVYLRAEFADEIAAMEKRLMVH